MAALEILVQRYFEGEALSEGGAIADIIPVGATPSLGTRDLRGLLVPAGEAHVVSPLRIDGLPAGNYVVQARLPSGEILNETAHLSSDDASATVVFNPEPSPREWLSWQTYVGAAPHTLRRVRPVRDRSATDDTTPPASPPDDLRRIHGIGPRLEVSLGQRGIHRVEQLAGLSSREVDWLEKTTHNLRGRVARGDWVRQAVELVGEDRAAERVTVEGDVAVALPEGQVRPDDGMALEWDAAEAPGLVEPALRHFFRPEGAQPAPTSMVQAIDATIRAGNQALTPLVGTADMLSALATGQQGPPSGDLAPLGYMETGGPLAVWRLRGGIPGMPGCIDGMKTLPRPYLVADDGEVQWIAALPLPWPGPQATDPFALDVTFDRSIPGGSMMSILPRDTRTAPLLGFMKSGDRRAKLAILRHARESLFEKCLNPYAAAAGAYILIDGLRWSGRQRSGEEAMLLDDGRWTDWIDNLANWFPWLPDGRILQGWRLMLQEGDPGVARKRLLGAAAGGLPAYTGVFQLLVEGLQVFAQAEGEGAEDGAEDAEVRQALAGLDMIAMRIDPAQVFTTVRLTPRPTVPA